MKEWLLFVQNNLTPSIWVPFKKVMFSDSQEINFMWSES
jgi:hypothetical protein